MRRRISNPGPVGRQLVLVCPANRSTNADDYPKAAIWNNPRPGGAYHFTFNLFASLQGPFNGVKAFALDRAVDVNRRACQLPFRF